MAEKLNGRLEVVKINEPLSATDNCNYGELLRDKRAVTIHNALSYEGRSCLVRFDLRAGLYHQEPEGYFISSIVPPSFEGLAAEQYVLLGLWEKAYSTADIPTMQEIEQVYKPGNTPFLWYLKKGFSRHQGRYLITNGEITLESEPSNIARTMRRTDPQRASRVFVVESETDLEKIIAIVRGQNISLMIMEPLKKL